MAVDWDALVKGTERSLHNVIIPAQDGWVVGDQAVIAWAFLLVGTRPVPITITGPVFDQVARQGRRKPGPPPTSTPAPPPVP